MPHSIADTIHEYYGVVATAIAGGVGWIFTMALSNKQAIAVIEARFDRLEETVDRGFDKLDDRLRELRK